MSLTEIFSIITQLLFLLLSINSLNFFKRRSFILFMIADRDCFANFDGKVSLGEYCEKKFDTTYTRKMF